jgi:SAM-dependent methyltransferase
MLKSVRLAARRIYLELKTHADTINVSDANEYERLQYRPGQLEYTHPRKMILSTLEYFVPKLDQACASLGLERKDFSVLDAGARDGWTVEQLGEMGFSAHGVELVTELVEHAQSQGRQVVKGDVQSLPFPNASFNAAFCRHTLEHTTDPRKALAELIRVTAPQGLIFVSLPIERAAHGKHTTAIPNLRVLRRLVHNEPVDVIDLQRSVNTGVIIPDGDEALMILRRR